MSERRRRFVVAVEETCTYEVFASGDEEARELALNFAAGDSSDVEVEAGAVSLLAVTERTAWTV